MANNSPRRKYELAGVAYCMWLLTVGTPLRAWFAEISGDHQNDQVLALQQKCIPCGVFERNNGTCHMVRVFGVR